MGVKILTWNVNGIRALKIPLKQQLDNLDADIICLQETKVTRDQLDELTAIVDGYNSYFSFSRVKSGYSGVATYVRDCATPCRAEEGLTGLCCPASVPEGQRVGSYGHEAEFTAEELTRLDSEGRCIITEHKITTDSSVEQTLVVINVYCPRAEPGNQDRLEFKLSFYRLLQLRAEAILNSGSHVIILGDINTSHKKIDHCAPNEDEEFYANPGRQWMDLFLAPSEHTEDEARGEDRRRFFDTFRRLHPNEENAFTNWCTLTGARATNYGCRLDYILADVGLMPHLGACRIMADVEGSDHCPVVAEFGCRVVTAARCPPLCTKYLPQFAGRQQKLASFFTKQLSSESQNGESLSRCGVGLAGSQQYEITSSSLPSGLSQGESEGGSSSSDVDQCGSGQDNITEQQVCSSNPEQNVQRSPASSRIKRAASDILKQVQSKKSKDHDAVKSGNKQSNLLSFFNKPRVEAAAEAALSRRKPDASMQNHSTKMVDCDPGGCSSSVSSSAEVKPSSVMTVSDEGPRPTGVSAWKNLLKGPPQTPLCKGHQEPCVLRTVRKDGPNKGKQFWVCNRPEGHKTNPNARCDYFVWVSHKK